MLQKPELNARTDDPCGSSKSLDWNGLFTLEIVQRVKCKMSQSRSKRPCGHLMKQILSCLVLPKFSKFLALFSESCLHTLSFVPQSNNERFLFLPLLGRIIFKTYWSNHTCYTVSTKRLELFFIMFSRKMSLKF